MTVPPPGPEPAPFEFPFVELEATVTRLDLLDEALSDVEVGHAAYVHALAPEVFAGSTATAVRSELDEGLDRLAERREAVVDQRDILAELRGQAEAAAAARVTWLVLAAAYDAQLASEAGP